MQQKAGLHFLFPICCGGTESFKKIIGTHSKALGGVDTDVLSIVTQQNKLNMNI